MTDKNNEVTFDALDKQIKEAEIKKLLLLRDSMYSNDPSEILKAQAYMSNQKNPKQDPKAYFFPLDYSYRDGLDYKEIVTSVPDNVLRRVGRIHVIESIINTKINQIKDFMCFTTDDQKVGYTIRRKESLFTEQNKKKELTTQEKKKIEYIVEFLENGGENAKWDIHDDLHSFTDKVMRDSYTFNRSTFECERTLSDRLIKFIPVDAMTVRLLPTIDPWYKARNPDSKFIEKKGYLPRYCQIFNSQIVVNEITNEQIVWYPWELAFETRNKSTDIFRNGYGVSEIEILSQILTWILYGFQYNGNFFSQGSNPKGLLNIKSGDGGGQGMLNQLRQLWTSSVSGVENSHKMPVVEGMDLEFIDMHHCLHGDSEVITPLIGRTTLNNLLQGNDECFVELWDGLKFSKAKVFKTGKKRLCTLLLSNNLEIKSSPDHRFLVLHNNQPTWIQRKDIVVGDFIFISKQSVEDTSDILYYKGKEVESDLFELMGWITGDGHIGDNVNSKRMIKTFYHPKKEGKLLDYHLSVCEKYGINAHRYINTRKDEEIDGLKNKYGIKTVIKENPYIAIVDSEFYNWFIELGFTTSREGKNIPNFLHSFKSTLKCAFLRGFFSADGHVSKNGSRVDITISNPNLKHQTKMLLMSEGIRCSSYKSKRTASRFGTFSEDVTLLIKDKNIFFDKINFLQEAKQNREIDRKKSFYTISEAPVDFVRDLAVQVKVFNRTLSDDEKLSKKDLHDLLNISKGHQKASLSKVLYYAELIGFPIPSFITDYNLEKVVDLHEVSELVDMVDVEMYDNDHRFAANGIIVHNSNKDMEFDMWIETLIVLTCSVMVIDPSELGFNFKKQAQIFGQDGQKERLNHSKEKGLKPSLIFLEKMINKYIVSELDDKFEFKFTGVDIDDETQYLDNDVKKVSMGGVSLEDIFEKYSGRKLNPDKDTILNPVYLQSKQMAMYGGEQSNQVVDQEFGGEDQGAQNPFAEYESDETQKSQETDPITKAAQDWVRNRLNR